MPGPRVQELSENLRRGWVVNAKAGRHRTSEYFAAHAPLSKAVWDSKNNLAGRPLDLLAFSPGSWAEKWISVLKREPRIG